MEGGEGLHVLGHLLVVLLHVPLVGLDAQQPVGEASAAGGRLRLVLCLRRVTCKNVLVSFLLTIVFVTSFEESTPFLLRGSSSVPYTS